MFDELFIRVGNEYEFGECDDRDIEYRWGDDNGKRHNLRVETGGFRDGVQKQGFRCGVVWVFDSRRVEIDSCEFDSAH